MSETETLGPHRVREPFSLPYNRALEAQAMEQAEAKRARLLKRFNGYENRGARSLELYESGHYDVAVCRAANVAQWELYYPVTPNRPPMRKYPKPEDER